MSAGLTWLDAFSCEAAFAVLLNVSVKATFLLLFAMLANTLLRREAAALRHRVWCLAFCGLLVVPVLMMLLPSWRMPILPTGLLSVSQSDASASERTASSVADSGSDLAASLGMSGPAQREPQSRLDAKAIPVQHTSQLAQQPSGAEASKVVEKLGAEPLLPGQDVAGPFDVGERFAASPRWAAALMLLWFAGACVTAWPLAMSLLRNRALHLAAQSAEDEAGFEWVQSLSKSLGLRRRVRLLETSRGIAPMTWGFLRPIVLLPIAWREWSRQRCEFVLLHELAHVKRCDVAFQIIARFCCALYWFHPLGWYALRRLRIERELACDDCVLMIGARPSDYARELLDIACLYQSVALPTAVAMAQTTNLEQRILALLDRARPHCPLNHTATRLVLLAATLLITGVTVVRPSERELRANEERKAATEAVRGSTNRPSSSQVKEPPTKLTAEDDPTFHFRGRVLNPDGKPVSGAKLFFVYWIHGSRLYREVKPQAVANADGWFDFTAKRNDVVANAESAYARTFLFPLVAIADGYGFAEQSSAVFETTGQVVARLPPLQREFYNQNYRKAEPVLRLVKDDFPIQGRVVTTEGRPVSDVRVRIDRLWYNKEGNLDSWEAASHEEKADFYSLREHTPEVINGPQLQSIIPQVLTDADGRFSLRGVGHERVAQLLISGPGVETALVKTRTRSGETIQVPNSWQNRHERDNLETYFPAQFTHVAASSIPIVGRITDAETGEAIPGVTVSDGQSGTFFRRGKPWISASTGEDGRYRLEGLPIGREETIFVLPPHDTAYLPAGLDVRTTLREAEVVHDFALRRGVWIRGKAIDDRTGEPLSGRVQYYVDRSNPHIKEYSAYARGSATHERRTGADGRFEIPVLPGRGIVTFMPDDHSNYRRGAGADGITIPSKGSNREIFDVGPGMLVASNEAVLQEVTTTIGSAPLEIVLKAVPGLQVVGKLFDPTGKQLTEGRVQVVGNTFHFLHYNETDHLFHVQSYFPDEGCDVFFFHVERNLAGHLHLAGKPKSDLAVTLRPAGSLCGRLVDDDGAPLAHVRLRGQGIPTQDYGDTDLRVATDGDGRFLIRGLIPGRKYTVEALGDGVFGPVFIDEGVDSAKTKDVGDVTVQTPE